MLKAGDNVLYGKYAGTEVEIDGEKVAHHATERRLGRGGIKPPEPFGFVLKAIFQFIFRVIGVRLTARRHANPFLN